MDQSESTRKLNISGYTFTKSHVDDRGRVHWKYVKNTDLEECRERSVPTDSSKDKQKGLRSPEKSKQGHQSTCDDLDEDSASAKKKWKPDPRQTPAPCSKQVSETFNRSIVQDKVLSGSSPVEVPQNQRIIEDGPASNSGQKEDVFHKPTAQGKPLLGSDQVKNTSHQTTIPDRPPIQSDQAMVVAHQPTILDEPACSSRRVNATAQQLSADIMSSAGTALDPHSIGVLIRSKLCISGYMYNMTCKLPNRRTYWECTRYRAGRNKKEHTERCRARAITLNSPNDYLIVVKGPKKSKHNHQPIRAEVDRALGLERRAIRPRQKQVVDLQSESVDNDLHQACAESNFASDNSKRVENPLQHPATDDQTLSDSEEEITTLDQPSAQDKPLAGANLERAVLHRPLLQNESLSGTINQDTITVRQIGKRLYVNGYIYVRKSRPSGTISWLCRRFAKKNISQKCEARVSTIAESSLKITFRDNGPRLSEHNHPPMPEDVLEAESILKPGRDKNFTYKIVSIERTRNSNQPSKRDLCDWEMNPEVRELNFDMESYRRFLMVFSEKPRFDGYNIKRALDATPNLICNRRAAAITIAMNRDKVMRDLKSLIDDPRICKIPTRDGNYSLYEPGDASAENFCQDSLARPTLDKHCDIQRLRGREDEISAMQGEDNDDGSLPVAVSLPIKDVTTYWPPILDPDSLKEDSPVDAETASLEPPHRVDIKQEHDLCQAKEPASNTNSQESSKNCAISEPTPQPSKGTTGILSATPNPLPNLSGDKKQIVPGPQSYFQGISRPSLTINQVGSQFILVATQPTQSDFSSTKGQIVTNPQDHFQVASRPTASSVYPTGQRLILPRVSQPDLSGQKNQTVISSQGQVQITSKPTAIDQFGLQMTINQGINAPLTLNLLYNDAPPIQALNVPAAISNSQVLPKQNSVGLISYTTPTIGHINSPIVTGTQQPIILQNNYYIQPFQDLNKS